jgi:hypothetical protein
MILSAYSICVSIWRAMGFSAPVYKGYSKQQEECW